MLESVMLEILFAAEKNEEKKEYIFFNTERKQNYFKKRNTVPTHTLNRTSH